MIARSAVHMTRARVTPLLALLPAALLFANAGSVAAQPIPRWPGSWSQPRATLTHNLQDPLAWPAVHLVLLRGDPGANPPSHSKIMWWDKANATGFYAGQWRWREIDDFSGEITAAKFSDLGTIPAPGFDVFCTGAVHAGRKLLVGGGTGESGELGVVKSALYDPDLNTWTDQGDMAERRWYPSLLGLSDGRVLARSGSRFNPMYLHGGSTTTSGSAPTNHLYRLGLTPQGEWEGPLPQVGFFGQTVPEPRTHHSAAISEHSRWIFGGLSETGTYLADTRRAQGDKNPLGDDYINGWTYVNNGQVLPRPDGRMQSAAIVLGDTAMVIFGGKGRDVGGQLTVFNDIWLLVPYRGSNPPVPSTHVWLPLTQTGSEVPGPRFGHTMFYDEDHERILMFGGATNLSNTLAANDVWSLTINISQETATWTKVLEGSAGPSPSARMGHTMTVDRESERYNEGQDKRAAFLFGGRIPGSPDELKNDLWVLWITIDPPTGELAWFPAEPVAQQPVPAARADHAAFFDVRGELVVVGGDTGGSGGDATVWAADVRCPANCEIPADWRQMESIGSGRSGHVVWYEKIPIMARQSEVVAPSTATPGAWSTLTGSTLWQDFYPFNFVMPGEGADRIFSAGSDASSYTLDITGGAWQASAASGFRGGAAVMYRPGKVMKCGSRDNELFQNAVGTTKSIDLGAQTLAWTASGSMYWGRVNHNITMLPSGEVLATGGTGYVDHNVIVNPRQQPELWHPTWAGEGTVGIWYGATGTNALASDPMVRDYHSSAVLLPDGRVLVAGGDQTADRNYATLYSPPYLFDAQGRMVGTAGCAVSRPTIASAPATIGYGETFAIGSPTAEGLTSVCLIRAGAATHGFDQDQLYVPLAFSHQAPQQEVRAIAPRSSKDAPPGDYLLFVLNGDGVPSIARWVQLGNCSAPPCDTRPPAAIADVNVDLISESSVYLIWTAPADVGGSGTAAYDLRYSTSPIASDQAFAWATPFTTGVPAPGSPGSGQFCEVTGLSPSTTYYFAIKTRDGPGSWSAASNQAQATTLDCPFCGGSRARPAGASRTAAAVGDGEATTPAPSRNAGLLTAGSDGAAALAAEMRWADGVPVWSLYHLGAAESEALAGSDGAGVVLQASEDGTWRTRARLHTAIRSGRLGLRAPLQSGRAVFLGPLAAERARALVDAGGAPFELTETRSAQLGEVDLGTDAEIGTLPAGDTLQLVYEATSLGGRTAFGAFLLMSSEATGTVASFRPVVPADEEIEPSAAFAFRGGAPNPFAAATELRFDLPAAARVRVEVYDVQGRIVRALADRDFTAGLHHVRWDGRGEHGALLPNGVYLARVAAGAFRADRRLVLIR